MSARLATPVLRPDEVAGIGRSDHEVGTLGAKRRRLTISSDNDGSRHLHSLHPCSSPGVSRYNS